MRLLLIALALAWANPGFSASSEALAVKKRQNCVQWAMYVAIGVHAEQEGHHTQPIKWAPREEVKDIVMSGGWPKDYFLIRDDGESAEEKAVIEDALRTGAEIARKRPGVVADEDFKSQAFTACLSGERT